MKRLQLLACLCACFFAAMPLYAAAEDKKPVADDTVDMTCSDPEPQAFAAANLKMMQGMEKPITGDADRDFAAMMIPHHEGAVDMAKIELTYGKDPELKKLAKQILEAQQPEIGQMKAWLVAHPAAHPTGEGERPAAARLMTPAPGMDHGR